MTNSLVKELSKSDYYCNLIIATSNDIAKDIGISYSELWLGVMVLVISLILYYMIISFSSLYLNKFKIIFKCMFWVGVIFIGILIFIFTSIISTLYVNP